MCKRLWISVSNKMLRSIMTMSCYLWHNSFCEWSCQIVSLNTEMCFQGALVERLCLGALMSVIVKCFSPSPASCLFSEYVCIFWVCQHGSFLWSFIYVVYILFSLLKMFNNRVNGWHLIKKTFLSRNKETTFFVLYLIKVYFGNLADSHGLYDT